MQNLVAQVTSNLLPFSGVTLDALGEDEITLDSLLHGEFTIGRSGLAWLACGPHLEVVHAVTGERLSAYRFSGGGEHPPSVLAARDFSWLKRSGLLVGLEETEGSVLCLYDLGLSRVVKAVVIPGKITTIEPLVSYGGASTSTQHLHQGLRWFFGIAAVGTDLGHVFLLDLCLDDLSCSQSELDASDLQIITKSPGEIPKLREVSTRQGRHLCLQLNGPAGASVTALQYISRTNQLAVGFSDGFLQLWNMKSLKKDYRAQLEGGRVPVQAFTFQEPENDPRNCCYLWAVQSAQDLEGDIVSLHLLQLAFSERKCLASGRILYEGLEYCEERYSQDLSGPSFPHRAQASNTRLLSCQTIEKFRHHHDRDDSMNEGASPDTSLSIYSWQVKAYGQGAPSSYVGVFDINRWYHAQMPDSLRTGESLQNCPYLAVWCLDSVVQMVSPHNILDVVVHERSLSRGLPFICPPPEQYFNPTTYNFDATCLTDSGVVHLTCAGYQKETLSFLKKAAPCTNDIISTSYSHCLMSGLLSSRLADTQMSNLSQEDQLDAILSTAVKTSSLGLITGCIKQWTSEEQPGSALNLRYIMDWAWNKVVLTKEELDGICAPLFDSSSNFTDPQTLQLLRHSERLLSNLSAIFHSLLSEAQELTQKGLEGLMNKNLVSSLISNYAQVVLWFCRTGLLPEGSDEDALQISRPIYTHTIISNYYTIRREELNRLAKNKWSADCLMIDGLVGQCGERLTNLWKRDEGGTGTYPPLTLHALLDIYLLDNIDEAAKHAIVIYLLLDVMYSFPNKDGTSVESFPTAFAIPVGLVKLVQGLWLLDHHDHQSSFELLLHPAASRFHFEWQHERILQALMCQGQHAVALRYFHVTKPAVSTTPQARLYLSVLLHNRCLIEAWCLLRQHCHRLNISELLGFMYESCQELGLIKDLLKLPLGSNEQESLEKFLQGTGGLQNRELLMIHYLHQANYIPALQLNHSLKMNMVNERDPKLKERSHTRNSIMDQYGKVLPKVQRKLAVERAKPYQHPRTVHKEVTRPQPLSTITKRSSTEKVISRAGFINNVLTKIEEVWLGKDTTPHSSPTQCLKSFDGQSPTQKPPSLAFPHPFLGTPITLTSKRKSRLIDLVVHPSCQTPRPLLGSPRLPPVHVSPTGISKAPELSLLQTPQVVKRARALVASGPVFSAFTPQSILRSSLRPTPVATPSASPVRSVTPPPRGRDGRITFSEDTAADAERALRWTNGTAAEREISLLTRGSPLTKPTRKTWSARPAEEVEEEEKHRVTFLPPEGGFLSEQLRRSESESSSAHEAAADTNRPDAEPATLNTSQFSSQSAETTLEYFDAPLSNELSENVCENEEEDDVVTVNIKPQAEEEEPDRAGSEEKLLLTKEAAERKEEDVEEESVAEDDVEGRDELEPKEEEEEDEKEEKFESDLEDKSNLVTGTENAAFESPDQEVSPIELERGQEQDSEALVFGEKLQDLPAKDDEPDHQPEVPESSQGSVEVPQASEEAATASGPTVDPEQSTDLTEFVQQQLFGGDLSPPLTRSSIHASQSHLTSNSEPEEENEEEQKDVVQEVPAEDTPALIAPKSTNSVTSSEPTSTDSHSVVSVNDSEELSSPGSSAGEEDEEEDEEEEQQEEEERESSAQEEDSGSEVEIVEEIQGNTRLPTLQQSYLGNYMQTTTEQEGAEFSLMSPGEEIKMEDEDMEGEVVMVRLGSSDEVSDSFEEGEAGASYMELTPSTTLLVPLELMEDQHGAGGKVLLPAPELQRPLMVDELQPDIPGSFTLMLEVDEDGARQAAPAAAEQESEKVEQEEVQQEEQKEVQQESEEVEQEEVEQEEQKEVEQESEEVEQESEEVAQRERKEVKQESEEVEQEEQEEQKEEESQSMLDEVDQKILLGTDLHPSEAGDVGAPQPEGPSLDGKGDELEVAEEKSADQLLGEEAAEVPPLLQTEESGSTEESRAAEEQKDDLPQGLSEDLKPLTPSEAETSPAQKPPSEETEAEKAAPDPVQEEDRSTDPVVQVTSESTSAEEMNSDETKPLHVEEESVSVMELKAAVEAEEQQSSSEPAEKEEEKDDDEKEAHAPEEEETKETTAGHLQEEKTDQEVSTPAKKRRTPSAQRKTAPPTPTRKLTRGRAVTFSSSPQEVEEDTSPEEPKRRTVVSAPKSRTPRKAQQDKTIVHVSTPRRSTRKAPPSLPVDAEVDMEAESTDAPPALTTGASSPARRSARAAASRTALKPRERETSNEISLESEQQSTAVHPRRGQTPSKSRASRVTTPRRSSRRMKSSSEAEDTAQEDQGEQADAPPSKRTSTRSKKYPLEALPALLEEDSVHDQQLTPSPDTGPRKAGRITSSVYPQVKLVQVSLPESSRKKKDDSMVERKQQDVLPEPGRSSRRTPRSKLWEPPEENLPLLDSPLEVDSETPVADALIKRLLDEKKREGDEVLIKMTRTRTRSTKSSVEQPSAPPSAAPPELEESESSPVEHSVIYSPARRRRAKAETALEEEQAAPVTCSRRRANSSDSQEKGSSEEDRGDLDGSIVVRKTRKTSQRSARSKAVLEHPPIAEVDLISPLPSPAEPPVRAPRRIKDHSPPVTTMNLRRKRVIDTILSKPITRRRKL